MQKRVVILAGGISSRMKKPVEGKNLNLNENIIKEADEKAKSMIGIGINNRPFLDYLLFNLSEAGYDDVEIVISESDDSIKKYYGEKDLGNKFNGLTIGYTVQPIPVGRKKPLGTADALWHALMKRTDWSGEKFAVCNSDNLYSKKALVSVIENEYESAMINYDRRGFQFEKERVEAFAVTKVDAKGFLVDIIEKPDIEVVNELTDDTGFVGVSMNLFSFNYNSIFPLLEKVSPHPVRNEKELPSAVKMIVNKNPEGMFTIPMSEHVPDLTSKDDLEVVHKYLLNTYKNFSFAR